MTDTLTPPADLSEYNKLRATWLGYKKAGSNELAEVARRRMRAEGRRIAQDLNYEWNYCCYCDELHPAIMFPRRTAAKSGMVSYCSKGLAARRKGHTEPAHPVPKATAAGKARTRKCRKCGKDFTPAKGDRKERCPPCRFRKPKRAEKKRVGKAKAAP